MSDSSTVPIGLRPVSDEDRLRIACRAASIGVWQWNLLTNEMIYSKIAREICGFPEHGPVTLDMVQGVTHPDDINRTRAQAQRAMDPALRESNEFRYRLIRADTGEVRWVKAYGEAQFAVLGDGLRAVTFVGSLQDITDEKKREDAHAQQAERLRLAIDAGRMAVWEVDMDTNTITGSKELNRLYGFPDDSDPTVEELQSRYAPGEKERVSQDAERIMAAGGKALNFTIKHVWPDGTEKWLLVRAELCEKLDGPGQRIIGVVGDVTDAKRQEERLEIVARELRHRLMNLVAVINTIAIRSWPADRPETRREFQSRLLAIGKATDLMFPPGSAENEVTMAHLLLELTAPYRSPDHDPFTFSGPDVVVSDRLRDLAMAFHELATNALKYGALSVPEGKVDVRWAVDADGSLGITWEESSGPPVVVPTSTGLGTTLLTRALFALPDRVEVDFRASGVVCRINVRS